jgi:hypothetical protein
VTVPASIIPVTGSLVMPTLRLLTLSDEERRIVASLQRMKFEQADALRTLDAYYNGEQAIDTLGISMPPELADLRTALGWPRLAVDPLHERLDVEGFRFPDSDDADESMWEIWSRNDLDTEAPMGWLDALIFGVSYLAVGTSDDLDVPWVTVESPLNMVVRWDPRRRAVAAALQHYTDDDGRQFATLYLPNQTVELAPDDKGVLEVADRDEHRMGAVPVMRMANRSRVHDRGGRSEITPELRTVTNSAIRGLLRMEVGAEFFSTPQRWILGATEKDFQDADGNPKSAWETYIGRILALERDEEGNVPEIGQFNPADPSSHTKVLDKYAEIAAGIMGLDASYLGKSTDNPASADAIRMSTDRLVQKARRKQRGFNAPLRGAMHFARAFQSGDVPEATRLMEVLWRAPEIPTPAATTDAIAKQIESGYLPAESDVTGAKLGYTAMERRQIAADRKRAQAEADRKAVLEQARAAQVEAEKTRAAQQQQAAAKPAATAGVKPSAGAQERAQGDQQPRRPAQG